MKNRKYTVQQLVNDPSFVQWATGKSDAETTERWNRWVKQSEENRKIALKAQKKITGLRFMPPNLPDRRDEWKKIKRDIQQKGISTQVKNAGLDADNEKDGSTLGIMLKVAAVLLIGTFVGISLFVHQQNVAQKESVSVETIQTGYGEKKTIHLSEGSQIILAAGSKLTYKSNWLEQPVKRVKLTGEAYFSITPGKREGRPKFVVQTEDGSASVWGTRFTVNSHVEGTKVVLAKGEVRVNVAGTRTTDEGGPEIIMKPGQMASFKWSQPQVTVEEVDPAVYISWTTDELYFDNTPFSVLVNRIEDTYGLKVEVQDPELMDTDLSGSIDFRSLQGLLKATSEIMEVQFHREGNTLNVKLNNK